MFAKRRSTRATARPVRRAHRANGQANARGGARNLGAAAPAFDGAQNIARFTILNAPLTAEPLRKSSGVAGTLKSEPEQRWTVTVEAQLEILDGPVAASTATRRR